MNLTIRFTYETNRTRRFRFSTLDYDCRTKRSDITCRIYFARIASETYGGLKSFQTAMSFQPRNSLSFTYFLAFFCASYQKSRDLYDTNKLSVSKIE